MRHDAAGEPEIPPGKRLRFARRLSDAAKEGEELVKAFDRFFTKLDALPTAANGFPEPGALETLSDPFRELVKRLDRWRDQIQKFSEEIGAYHTKVPGHVRGLEDVVTKLQVLIDASRQGDKVPDVLLQCPQSHLLTHRRPHYLFEHYAKILGQIPAGVDGLIQRAEFVRWQVDDNFSAHISGVVHGKRG